MESFAPGEHVLCRLTQDEDAIAMTRVKAAPSRPAFITVVNAVDDLREFKPGARPRPHRRRPHDDHLDHRSLRHPGQAAQLLRVDRDARLEQPLDQGGL